MRANSVPKPLDQFPCRGPVRAATDLLIPVADRIVKFAGGTQRNAPQRRVRNQDKYDVGSRRRFSGFSVRNIQKADEVQKHRAVRKVALEGGWRFLGFEMA